VSSFLVAPEVTTAAFVGIWGFIHPREFGADFVDRRGSFGHKGRSKLQSIRSESVATAPAPPVRLIRSVRPYVPSARRHRIRVTR
jgi:hypothetical protein